MEKVVSQIVFDVFRCIVFCKTDKLCGGCEDEKRLVCDLQSEHVRLIVSEKSLKEQLQKVSDNS